ncbi:MAG TPA: alanyl-tRNA editing protein [Candidatus Methylomirabilis sp.]
MSAVPAYEREPYLQSLETDVIRVGTERDRQFVILAETILYPEGGGQPADQGWVGKAAVEDVRKVDEEIRHYLAGPPPGGRVQVALDWVRRFDHMQQHTGQHLLTAVVEQRFGWHTTAFHLGGQVSDIELDTAKITPEQLVGLEEAIAAEIRAARLVTARRVSPEEYAMLPVRTRGLPEGHTGDIRLVEIAGIDLNTCGGTHVRSTAEIEGLKLLGTEGMRGGTRLFYVAGGRLRRLLSVHHERTAKLRQLLGTADEELVQGVQARLDQLKDAQRAVKALEEELATAAGQALAARPETVAAAHWATRDLSFLQRVAREFARLAADRVILLTAGEGEQGAFLLAAGEQARIDLPAAGRRVAELLDGRGGGSGRMFQGKAARLTRRDKALAHLRSLL